MKTSLFINLIIFSFSIYGFAQRPKAAPGAVNVAPALLIKDMEYLFTYTEDPIKYLSTKGFKKTGTLSGNNTDTFVTANGKGDTLLLLVSCQGLTGLLFKTSSISYIKKITGEAAVRYQLNDSIELVKATGNENYLQKRFAFMQVKKAVLPSDVPPPPPDQAGSKFVFNLITPYTANGKQQYWIYFKKIGSSINTNSLELPNLQKDPVQVSAEKLARFQSDSIRVARYIQPVKVNPIAPGLLGRMNQFMLQHIFNDRLLPVQFIHTADLHSILITPDSELERSFEYRFNTAGQLVAVISGKQITDEVSNERSDQLFENNISFGLAAEERFGFDQHHYNIDYQQTIPVRAGDVLIDYNMDTVIAYNANWLRLYKMINQTFFLVGEFQLSPESYRTKSLSKDWRYALEEKDGKIYYSCTEKGSDKTIFKRCYSGTQWELPFAVSGYSRSHETYTIPVESYRKNQPGQLLREISQEGRLVYYIDNFKLTGLDKGKVMYKYYNKE